MNENMNRRQFIAATGTALGGIASQARAKPARGMPAELTIAQVVDVSPAQQDVSKEFLIGARAAWQDINARGGIRGRHVNHKSIEVDGSADSMRAAIASLKDLPDCVALSGTAGDRAAIALTKALQDAGLEMAHAAPWLQDSSLAIDDRTFPIFAGREEQVAHAMKSLTTVGFGQAAAVYATRAEWQLYSAEVQRMATSLKLKLQHLQANGELAGLGRTLPDSTPAVLLFIGGTPELLALLSGLERQQRLRYVVALADVNLQTVSQLGATKHTPIISTQPVPEVGSSAPIVRRYRETLARLFDEAPTPLSLAGFISARFTQEVLAEVESPTRASVLNAFRQRTRRDLGGFRIAFDDRHRSSSVVTQSMLAQDGRIVG